MNGALVLESDLKTWTGFERRADIEKLLRKHGIPVMYGRDGQVCTTVEALNASLLKQKTSDRYEFE